MTNNFDSWKVPKWHPDYGDPDFEFLLLKSFSENASNAFPTLTFELDSFEEGYICVYIKHADVKIAELQVTEVTINQLGLFSGRGEEDEMHFIDFSKGISFLSKLF